MKPSGPYYYPNCLTSQQKRRLVTVFKLNCKSVLWRSKFFCNLLASTLGLSCLFYLLCSTNNNEDQKENGDSVQQPQCKLPILPVDNPEIMRYIRYVDPIQCHVEDWMEVNGTHAFLTDKARLKYGQGIMCTYHDIIRVDDFHVSLSQRDFGEEIIEFKRSDFIHVSCNYLARGDMKTWESFLAAPRSSIPRVEATHINSKPPSLNVLIWAHDSLSRNMFMRKLPKSFAYLRDDLEGTILTGYNIIGDGTPQALIPIFTGQTETELPEVRTNMGSAANYMNVYPFIWNKFKAHGYLTGFLDDCSNIGTFNYRMKGFKQVPTDFYMRPYFLAATPHFEKYTPFCIGALPRHKVMMNYVKNIMEFRRRRRGGVDPKFIFAMHSELSHDHMNEIQGADDDLKIFLTDLKNKNEILNDTILIVMSDHGARFSSIRQTQQGKQEERLPFFMFVFPPWFKLKYPIAWENFIKNSQILSTPFDIHATLLDILKISTGAPEILDENYFRQPNKKGDRQMSLFRPVPLDRNCKDASIEPHWCACLDWNELNTESVMAKKAANHLLNYLNTYIEKVTTLCAPLGLGRIIRAANLRPANPLLKFKQSSDRDGRVPDLSDVMNVTMDSIQISLETVPGLARFEATIDHDPVHQSFQIHPSEISRINKYHQQSSCITTKDLEHVRKFCYCRDNVNAVRR